MKRFLPILFLILFLFSSFSVFAQEVPTATPIPAAGVTATPVPVAAATATPTPDLGTTGAAATQPIPGCIGGPTDPWRCDEEVTFMGKSASRAKDFLNWTMAHYKWAEYTADNPIGTFWSRIRNIMYGLLFLFVLATAFILIITRGKSITVMKFIPRFVFVLIFATLSFAIVQFLYQISDIIMGFFLQGPGLKDGTIDKDLKVISGDNLFFIGWKYESFIGYRSTNPSDAEAAFMSILLLKLTSITFYIMATLLLIRKVILWLFIAVSPVFPFLLLYYPIRNTGKIWIGEFFRWLLYGPLFAIFLYGLVALWQFQPVGAPLNAVGIPLNFETNKTGAVAGKDIKYPTAINIVIGGPGQTISRENNVNLPDTFVLYVFALIMVWVVTFFPFILLRIFLDHMTNMLSNENWLTRQMGKTPFPPPQSGPPARPVMPANPIMPPPPFSPKGAPSGMAKQMPTGAALRPADAVVNQQILKNANLSVPTLRDIARMETATMNSSVAQNQEVARAQQSLQKIANPAATTNSVERSQYTMVREKLTQESQSGNLFAKSILNAANTMSVGSMPQQRVSDVIHKVANPTIVVTPSEKEQFAALHEKVIDASQKGDTLAKAILDSTASASQLEDASKKGDKVATAVLDAIEQQSLQQIKLPTVNRVQAVSLDDYEAVKKMWKENYQKLEPPVGVERNEWISKDQQKISDTINLLSSPDAVKEKEGMQMVSNILPFLMIGGFSKTEVIAYLKAKQEAGKDVLEVAKAKEEDEESKVVAGTTAKAEQKTMSAEVEEEPKVPKELEDTPKG
ncbi:MAG: hypothetical protein KBD46_01600 [Candidatus Levybacteria bacterium]|nr:hypothetical protein [Candidatus Levybacteria bacterium]